MTEKILTQEQIQPREKLLEIIRAWRTTYTSDNKNLDGYAVQEMAAVYTAALLDAGQTELPLAEEPAPAIEETVQF
jgi:hypothetical protein